MSALPTFGDEPPDHLVEYLRSGVHTGRGTGHVNALTDMIVPSLAAHPLIAPAVEQGRITYYAGARQGDRGTDLLFGKPSRHGSVFDSEAGMLAGRPEEVQIVGRYTSIMTEHAKAQRNRREDFFRFAQKCDEQWGSEPVRFGVCPVNAADEYYSHTAKSVNRHGNGELKAARAVDILRAIPIRHSPIEGGLDAMWIPVVMTNNSSTDAGRVANWLTHYPQPADGQPMSFSWFIDAIANAYHDRFGSPE
jgi:hypothetical protein